MPDHGLFLSSAIVQDPKPREAVEHRAMVSMATTRQEMGKWGERNALFPKLTWRKGKSKAGGPSDPGNRDLRCTGDF